MTIYIGEAHNVFPDIDVQFEGEEGVTGTDLWEMSIWFNKNADGSGKKTDLAENTLTREQRNQPLVITESLVFEVRQLTCVKKRKKKNIKKRKE